MTYGCVLLRLATITSTYACRKRTKKNGNSKIVEIVFQNNRFSFQKLPIGSKVYATIFPVDMSPAPDLNDENLTLNSIPNPVLKVISSSDELGHNLFDDQDIDLGFAIKFFLQLPFFYIFYI